MEESYLCDLHRHGRQTEDFVCHAFRPCLTLVGQKGAPRPSIPVCQDKGAYFAEVVQMIGGGRCGGKGGCAASGCYPGEKAGSRKRYHIVWGVNERRPIFAENSRFVPFFHEVFLSCGRLLGGQVLLLWLAADHLHLYLDFNGADPVRDVVEDLQELVSDTLLQEFVDLGRTYRYTPVWERNFFLEEIPPKGP